MDKAKELHDFYVRVDSLLSLLVHRYNFLGEIGEKEEAIKLYQMARDYSTRVKNG